MVTLDYTKEHPFLTTPAPLNESKNDMKLRHRKEVKQLTNDLKLYAKNSSFSKSDLKTWLSKLQDQHSSQLAKFDKSEPEPQFETLPIKDITETKQYKRALNKAAKKAAEMEEVQREIMELEKLANSKQGELDRIVKNLPEGFRVKEMPPDGACLFYSVASQLQDNDAKKLRHDMVSFMRDKFDEFGFFAGAESDEEYSKYLDTMDLPCTWGGDIEIAALSSMLGKAITVYFADQKERRYGSLEGDDIKVSYHRYWLASGNHYNAVLATNTN